jgi:flagellar hook protein FlgE
LGLNLPAGAAILPESATYTTDNPYSFDRNDSDTFNKSTSITVYDSLGNPHIATVYYVKTSSATEINPTNKWDTKIFIGDKELDPSIIAAKNDKSETQYMNKFGQISTNPAAIDPTFNAAAAHPLYFNDDQQTTVPSSPGATTGGYMTRATVGHDFGSTDSTKVTIVKPTAEVDTYGFTADIVATGTVSFAHTTDSVTTTYTQPFITSHNATLDALVTKINAGETDFKAARVDGKVTLTAYNSTAIPPQTVTGFTAGSTALALSGVKEVDTVTFGASVASGGTLKYNYGGTTYSKAFDTDAATTIAGLVTLINAGETTVTAAAVSGSATTFTITKVDGSDTQMTKGTVGGTASGTGTAEVDTITLGAAVAASGSVSYTYAGTTYTQAFATDAATTVTNLVALINAGTDPITAAATSGTVFTITSDMKSSTQMTKGTIGGTTNGTTALTITTADTTAGVGLTATTADTTVGSLIIPTADSAGWPTEGGGTFSGSNFVTVSVDGSNTQTIDIAAGSYTGTELATLMTLNLNAKFGDEKSYKMPTTTADRTITLELQDSLGNDINKAMGPEVDTFTFNRDLVVGENVTFAIGSNTYTQAFDSNNTKTLDALAVKINAGESAFDIKRVDKTLVMAARSSTALGSVTVGGSVTATKADTAASTGTETTDLTIVVDQYQENTTNFSRTQLVANVQAKVDAVTYIGTDSVAHKGLPLTVGYDLKTRALTFTPTDATYGSIKASSPSSVAAFGLDSATATFSSVGDAFSGGQIVPTGAVSLDAKQQRTGLLVTYSKDAHKFSFSSGTTGEASKISVGVPSGTAATGGTSHLLGIGATYATEVKNTIGTGLASTAGIVTGSKAGVDITGTFSVTTNDNSISVTIDGVDGTVVVPPAAYTGHTFATAIQDRVNLIQHTDGRQVNDVSVKFDQTSQSFTVTSGTVGATSSVNINGHSNWGFDTTTQTRGVVPAVTVVTQATDTEGNLLYIDQAGKQTTAKPDATPSWTPIYLDKGELTFDTYGKLISPKEGVAYSPFDPSNGSDLLTLGVDYGKFSTQYSAPFSVLSLSQDGYPSGQLDGLDIDSGGVVRANYTNGTQVALGKLMMANFANPNGLKQVGNANFKSTTNSGAADLGEAGSDGFGAIQGGALERANVDLTEELVALITAQRNFQANAKAIETSSSLTQTIINIRG